MSKVIPTLIALSGIAITTVTTVVVTKSGPEKSQEPVAQEGFTEVRESNSSLFTEGMVLAKKTAFASSVEERDRIIAEIGKLGLSESEHGQIMRIVVLGKSNFLVGQEHKYKPEKAMELVHLANNANSVEERQGYIRQIDEVGLTPMWRDQCKLHLQLGERAFLRRIKGQKVASVPEVRPVPPKDKKTEEAEEKPKEEQPAPAIDISLKRFVMIVHGWNSGPGTLENPDWPLKMGLAYARVIDPSVFISNFKKVAIGYSLVFSDVEIVVADWSSIANAWSDLWREGFDKSKQHGDDWGQVYYRRWNKLTNGGPTKVHLIAHSAGCIFIDSFCKRVQKGNRQIQVTFLDAFLPDDASLEEKMMGQSATFAEHYLQREGGLKYSLADFILSEAYNIDVSDLEGKHRIVSPKEEVIKDHAFPYVWYLKILNERNKTYFPGPMYTTTLNNAPIHSEGKHVRGHTLVLKRK